MFFVEHELVQTYSIIESRENSERGNVLATEMRWKQTNMLSQSRTWDKSVVPNLPPALKISSDLMAQSVFPFKMSHQGTINTSISQRAPGNTQADTLKEERTWNRLHTKGRFKYCLLNTA